LPPEEGDRVSFHLWEKELGEFSRQCAFGLGVAGDFGYLERNRTGLRVL
jgi:hypothetical protein